jgi:sugar phosphate permease
VTLDGLRFSARIFRFSLGTHILAVICLMYLVFYVDRVNIATLAPLKTADLGLSNVDFGLAVSAFAYPYAAFQLIGGWVGDRLGPRLGLILCGVLVSVATALTGSTEDLRQFGKETCWT